MTLISDSIKLSDLQHIYNSWLDTILYQDIWEETTVTNRTIINSGE